MKPTTALCDALEALAERYADATLLAEVSAARHNPRGDLTPALLRAAEISEEPLPAPLLAAVCRAACKRFARHYPGAAVELRVPPYAAVQVGFGEGPRHTRGTPPNVVEMAPATFVELLTGRLTWGDAAVYASGAHAQEVAQLFSRDVT